MRQLTARSSPGRFYSSVKMKLVLAYIAKNYDIERLEKRPQNHWFGSSTAPPFESILRIRRRSEKMLKSSGEHKATKTVVDPVPSVAEAPQDVRDVIHESAEAGPGSAVQA